MSNTGNKKEIRRKAILEKIEIRSNIKANDDKIEDYYIEELMRDLIRDDISISSSTLTRDINVMNDVLTLSKMGPLQRIYYKK